MNFHLGTVAFGSFILTMFAVFKAILRACFRNACCRCVTTVYCSTVEVILKFLSDNSFIETGTTPTLQITTSPICSCSDPRTVVLKVCKEGYKVVDQQRRQCHSHQLRGRLRLDDDWVYCNGRRNRNFVCSVHGKSLEEVIHQFM
jgi:hypothetical protein